MDSAKHVELGLLPACTFGGVRVMDSPFKIEIMAQTWTFYGGDNLMDTPKNNNYNGHPFLPYKKEKKNVELGLHSKTH
jgi:hypothetical protein